MGVWASAASFWFRLGRGLADGGERDDVDVGGVEGGVGLENDTLLAIAIVPGILIIFGLLSTKGSRDRYGAVCLRF